MSVRKIGSTCYFIKGNHFGKCYIEKVIMIATSKETIMQYEIRPYGLNKPLQVHAENLYDTFEIARQEVIRMLQESYEKQIEIIKNDNETKFDDWEAKYQTELKSTSQE